LNRVWLTPADEADFDVKISDINGLYKQAPELAKQGQRIESTKVFAFIEYYNRTMAKPFKWTYQGKALAA